jgi:hypothetical protein
VDAGRQWSWADVTLETYYADTCENFATGDFIFEDLQMYTEGGSLVEPDWTETFPEPTECSGSVTVNSPYSITISHNV